MDRLKRTCISSPIESSSISTPVTVSTPTAIMSSQQTQYGPVPGGAPRSAKRARTHDNQTFIELLSRQLENDSKFRSAELKTRQCELELKRKETEANVLKLHEEAHSEKIRRCALLLRERKLLQDLGIDQNELDKALPLEF
jgi:hypothetical protein